MAGPFGGCQNNEVHCLNSNLNFSNFRFHFGYMKSLLFFALSLVYMASNAQLQRIAYSDGNQKLAGFYISPSQKMPHNAGVLILPAWMGVDDHSKASAEKLSKEGFHAFVADIYGEGNYPKGPSEAGPLAGHYKKNFKEYHRRIDLALKQLIKSGADPNNIAVIGYCFGGTGALEAARAGMPVKGVVAFHGGLGKDSSRPDVHIKPKVLVCHGADDTFVPEAEIQSFQNEMREGKADWQMVYYADAVHGFTEPSAGNDKSKGVAYNEKAANRSWEHMLLFFDELFN